MYEVKQETKIQISDKEAERLTVEYLKKKFLGGSDTTIIDGQIAQYELVDYHKRDYEYVKKRPATELQIAAFNIIQTLTITKP